VRRRTSAWRGRPVRGTQDRLNSPLASSIPAKGEGYLRGLLLVGSERCGDARAVALARRRLLSCGFGVCARATTLGPLRARRGGFCPSVSPTGCHLPICAAQKWGGPPGALAHLCCAKMGRTSGCTGPFVLRKNGEDLRGTGPFVPRKNGEDLQGTGSFVLRGHGDGVGAPLPVLGGNGRFSAAGPVRKCIARSGRGRQTGLD
jgi:hypothetical protein